MYYQGENIDKIKQSWVLGNIINLFIVIFKNVLVLKKYLFKNYYILIYRFFSRYQSLDALKSVPKNFGGVGEEEVTEAISLATETMTVGSAFVGMAEIACEKDFFQ